MEFKDFIKENKVKKMSLDKNLAKALLKTSINDLRFLDKLKINETSSRKLMSNYYDILRSILESIAAREGYKIYSHEAFTYYLNEKNEKVLSLKFDRFRKIRNSINYYGKDISIEQTKENITEIKNMIKYLIKKYLRGLLWKTKRHLKWVLMFCLH